MPGIRLGSPAGAATRAVLLMSAVACSGASKTAGPPQQHVGASCSPSGTITLSVLQSTTLDCSQGTTLTLTGNGATYLIVPQFAVGNVNYSAQPFEIGRLGAPPASATLRSTIMQGGTGRFVSPRLVNPMQARFDLRLRAADHARSATRVHGASLARSSATSSVHGRGTPQGTSTFWIIADSTGTTFKQITATLAYSGTNVYVYIDTAAPANGFTAGQLTQFGQYADQFLYPLDLNTFGAPTDIDNNGHVIMLLSPVVNSLTPASECAAQGFIAGFFDGTDLTPADPHSNKAEIFYQIVPDSAGKFSCKHTVNDVDNFTPGTFLHELQHMINFGHHVVMHGGASEEGWLDEGESIVATELGARFYDAKYPPPTGRSGGATQVFPDSAEKFIIEQLLDSYNYLALPDTQSLTLHSDADGGLFWRGGDWLLLRYVGDQFDSTVYAKLENGTVTGTANLAQATGMPFAQMFGNFGQAVYTDSLPGVARSSIPAADRFVSYNFRFLYGALYNSFANQDGIDAPFPISLQSLSPSSSVSGSMVPGTASYYQLATPSGSATVNVIFSPSSGSFPSGLHPQVSVFRLQ